jgi:hypothetical protein
MTPLPVFSQKPNWQWVIVAKSRNEFKDFYAFRGALPHFSAAAFRLASTALRQAL